MNLQKRLSKVLGVKVERPNLQFRKRPENEIVQVRTHAYVRMLNDKTKMAVIDVRDIDLIRIGRWSIRSNGYCAWKLRVGGKTRVIYMHRFIFCGCREVDHKNRDRMDNRRENLRRSKHRQNICNQSKRSGCSSRFKGVYKKGNRWGTTIRHPVLKKSVSFGTFRNETDAAKRYNRVAIMLHGKFAVLNDI